MSYYTETALTSKNFRRCTYRPGMKVHIERNHPRLDVFMLPECEEYLTCHMSDPCLWHDTAVLGITHRYQVKADKRWDSLYKEHFYERYVGAGDPWNTFLWLSLGIFYFTFFFDLFAILMNRDMASYVKIAYVKLGGISKMALSFSLIKLFQWLVWNSEIPKDCTFNRRNGMVEIYKGDKKIYRPFTDFRPSIITIRTKEGKTDTSLSLFNKKTDDFIPIDSSGLYDSMLCWSYLRQFMDTSRPLPDTPEHEATRHLDPTTRAYDEKTGRNPFYWRNKSKTELKQMQKEARKRAEQHYDEIIQFY